MLTWWEGRTQRPTQPGASPPPSSLQSSWSVGVGFLRVTPTCVHPLPQLPVSQPACAPSRGLSVPRGKDWLSSGQEQRPLK